MVASDWTGGEIGTDVLPVRLNGRPLSVRVATPPRQLWDIGVLCGGEPTHSEDRQRQWDDLHTTTLQIRYGL